MHKHTRKTACLRPVLVCHNEFVKTFLSCSTTNGLQAARKLQLDKNPQRDLNCSGSVWSYSTCACIWDA